MSIQNYSYNPFNLSTAVSAWSDTSTPLLTKVCKASIGAVHDMYVKNPYDLTIGNCLTLAKSKVLQSTLTKIAVVAGVAFSSLYTLMLYGSSIHVIGCGLVAFGSTVNLSAIGALGETIKAIGANIFLTGAVPNYAIFYELPKYIILSVPKVAQFVADKISFVSNWIFLNALQPMWAKVIVPVLQTIRTALTYVASQIKTALDAVGKTIVSIVEVLFKRVLQPLWQKFLFPLLHKMGNAIHFTYRSIASVLEGIVIKVAHTAQWVIKNLILPFWNQIVVPAFQNIGNAVVCLSKGIANVISAVVSKVGVVAHWIFQHLLVPMWNNLLFPVLNAADNALRFVVNMLAQSLQKVGQAVAKAATFVFQKIIAPMCNGMIDVLVTIGRFCNAYVIKPLTYVLTSVADKVATVFKAIFDGLVVPIAKAVASIASLIKNRLLDITTAIHQSVTSVWNQIGLRFTGLQLSQYKY